MAEDQSVNGTIWNKEANAILSWFGWKAIGDIDMDVTGDDDKEYGVDTLLRIETPQSHLPFSAILEAKRYCSDSFSLASLQGWVNRLDKKLAKLRFSEPLQSKFPSIQECKSLNLGIIAIWFHDTNNYPQFKSKFKEALANLKVSSRPKSSGGYNKILIIDNEAIGQLCSLHNAVTSYQTKNSRDLNYLYPSILRDGKATNRSKVLSPDFVFSKVILAESKGDNGADEVIVFYFGDTNLDSFKLLRDQLSKCSVLDEEKKLVIFVYNADDEFRKIKPELSKIFDDTKEVVVDYMDSGTDLPGEIKKIGHE